ncbi:MAG: hypothetical protein CME64_18015 [Halobacteriovoraceae bacterium]|nr:hypothetical protein [Halobacteriovoraceae bacterium]
MGTKKATILFTAFLAVSANAQLAQDLVLEDPEDIKLLMNEFPENEGAQSKKGKGIEDLAVDDLEELKEDLGDIEFTLPDEKLLGGESSKPKIITGEASGKEELIFDVGKQEEELLELTKTLKGKIPADEWKEIADATTQSSYTVQKGDWLWKISKKLFGSGFYYSKIWALNPYITNPHLIEPGMVLTFDTGSQSALPKVGGKRKDIGDTGVSGDPEFAKWGTDAKPEWLTEKEALKKQGVYIQYSSADTAEDLKKISSRSLVTEYEAYEPPRPDFLIEIPGEQYDETGFDRSAKVSFDFKEGFYLNTFISTNVVQDFGKVDSAIEAKQMFTMWDNMYLRFDDNLNVIPGDKFSIYTAQGGMTHRNSDREGFKYTIVASVKTVKKLGDLWECEVIESAGVVNRGDRITVYTPKIESITSTFNTRIIEAILLGAFQKHKKFASTGDVIYLDRGRADGVEMGNVFEVYGFEDRGTGRKITTNPTYKNGEVTVISLTDNFSTALVTQSRRDFNIGDIAVTKTKESAARAYRLNSRIKSGADSLIEDQALEELDVELNLDDLNDELLDKADRIQFTEDELSELERQEREKSIMSEEEKDLRALERLESEIEDAERMLRDSKLSEDKWLEGQSLDKIEKDLMYTQQESLDEIEENFGKRYLDENLNDKENPFGLTELDIEEIDELLNIETELEENK